MPDHEMMKEILRLTQENNKMLRSMRRSAFLKSVLQFVIYGILLLAPLWLYMQYLAPTMNQLMGTVNRIQGTGAQAQAQFGDLQALWQQFSENFQAPESGPN